MDKTLIMNDYALLIKLTKEGILEMKPSTMTEDIRIIKNGQTLVIENGVWENEAFFHNNVFVGERNLTRFSDGEIYEDKIITYNGFDELK